MRFSTTVHNGYFIGTEEEHFQASLIDQCMVSVHCEFCGTHVWRFVPDTCAAASNAIIRDGELSALRIDLTFDGWDVREIVRCASCLAAAVEDTAA